MKKVLLLITITATSLSLLASAFKSHTLKGWWEYRGGVYSGKKEAAPEGYKIRRKYDASHFEAFLIEPDTTPQKFQAGNYQLTADSCFETETYTTLPSKVTGVTLHYSYNLKHDTLIFRGELPSGMHVEEYWMKVK